MAEKIHLRRWSTSEREPWEKLFREYVFDFYKMSVTDEAVDATWKRLFEEKDIFGFCASDENDKPIGLVHYLPQTSCWETNKICYIEDLFVSPEARGKGVGRLLIEAVCEEAKKNGWPKVFWETQEFNYMGRILYDKEAKKTDFIIYEKEISLL